MREDPSTDADAVRAVLRFNRYCARHLTSPGGRLQPGFSPTAARVLCELAQRDGHTASEIGRLLDINTGYLSRILNQFQKRGLLSRAASARDARRILLTLTPAGRAAFEELERTSKQQAAVLLAPLTATQTQELLQAMRTIEQLLEAPGRQAEPYVLRPHRIGDIAWVASRQGLLYAQEYGWNGEFEAFVAEIGARFILGYDPSRECCWIAERYGAIVGSAFVVRESDEEAKLRMLYVEPAARRLGVGSRLVAECIAFARKKGYHRLTLSTNDVLVSARRIYEAAGFRLVREEPHHSFGTDLVGQYWELPL